MFIRSFCLHNQHSYTGKTPSFCEAQELYIVTAIESINRQIK